MSQPLLCDRCETLNPLPTFMDYFQLMGLPRRFGIDLKALHENYITLSRHSHPDFHVEEQPEVVSLAMTVSAAVNEAYRTLSDPIRRAGYLLELQGGPASAQDKSVPDGFLNTMLMIQEEVEDARAAADPAAKERLKQVLLTQREGLMKSVERLFAELEEASGCEATRQQQLHEIREQLNAVSFVRKSLSQLE
jgi:molecular chaperone HscB